MNEDGGVHGSGVAGVPGRPVVQHPDVGHEHQPVGLRDDGLDFRLDLLGEFLGLLDPRARLGPDVDNDLPGVRDREQLLTEERVDKERRCEQGQRPKDREPPGAEGDAKQPAVAGEQSGVPGLEHAE